MRIIAQLPPGLSNDEIAEIVAEKIISIGFSCKMCGECCLSHEGRNMVIISPQEIRKIMNETSLEWDQIAEPYPEFIQENGASFTFSWILKRNRDCCIFYRNNKCAIYNSRTSICRTYPFMITEDALLVSECSGIGSEITSFEARQLAYDLVERRNKEMTEEEMIERVYDEKKLETGYHYVIDSEGVKNIDR